MKREEYRWLSVCLAVFAVGLPLDPLAAPNPKAAMEQPAKKRTATERNGHPEKPASHEKHSSHETTTPIKGKPKQTSAPVREKAPDPPRKTVAKSAKAGERPTPRNSAVAPAPPMHPAVEPRPLRAEAHESTAAVARGPEAVPMTSPPPAMDETTAWKTYQAASASAWKKYQAKAISRAEYDAEIRRAWSDYAVVAHNNYGFPGSGNKAEALSNLKTWLQLEYCNSRTALAEARRPYGISAPTTASGSALAGLLDRYVQTVASDSDARRMESELRDYAARDIGEIELRIDTLQRRLATRDTERAYAVSWCSRS